MVWTLPRVALLHQLLIWRWMRQRRKHWICWERVDPVGELPQRLSRQPGAILSSGFLYSCCFVYAFSLSVYDEKISLTALGRIKDRLENLNSNVFNFLKIFHFLIFQDKTYEISAAAGKKIKMSFAAFSLENSWRCGWDYLTVSNHCYCYRDYLTVWNHCYCYYYCYCYWDYLTVWNHCYCYCVLSLLLGLPDGIKSLLLRS